MGRFRLDRVCTKQVVYLIPSTEKLPPAQIFYFNGKAFKSFTVTSIRLSNTEHHKAELMKQQRQLTRVGIDVHKVRRGIQT
jgi:hypothetical protein